MEFLVELSDAWKYDRYWWNLQSRWIIQICNGENMEIHRPTAKVFTAAFNYSYYLKLWSKFSKYLQFSG